MKVKLTVMIVSALMVCLLVTLYEFVRYHDSQGVVVGVAKDKAAKFTIKAAGHGVTLTTDSMQNMVIETSTNP